VGKVSVSIRLAKEIGTEQNREEVDERRRSGR
jgi:hypothetical protein